MKPNAPASRSALRPAWRRALQRVASALGLAGWAALVAPAMAAPIASDAQPSVLEARAALDARVARVRSALRPDAAETAEASASSPTAQWVNWPNWGNWNNWNNWPNWGNWGNWFNR